MYLSSIHIENYKGIKKLDANFQKDINVIIGENGSCKTALIDAIRLLYNLGNQQRELYVTVDDFYLGESVITISYEFRDLTTDQKGAFYEYVVLGEKEENDFASANSYLESIAKQSRVCTRFFCLLISEPCNSTNKFCCSCLHSKSNYSFNRL